MKHILKNKDEPDWLKKYKSGDSPSYSGYGDKIPNSTPLQHPIRNSLLEEQGYICAYCMREISLDRDTKLNQPQIIIEHYRSQSRYPKLNLDYQNMLGVCNGNEGYAPRSLTCDKAKSKYDKERDLVIDPLDSYTETLVQYTNEGVIFSEDEKINNDLKDVLNLNQSSLQEERKSLFQLEKDKIRNYKRKVTGNRPKVKAFLQKRKVDWETKKDGKFRPLCRVPLYVIEKELKKYN